MPASSDEFSPPGRLVGIGGHRLHVHVAGEAGPPVVFEAAGLDFSPTWALVQPGVAAAYRARSVFDTSRIETMMAELEGLDASQDEVRAVRPAGLDDIPLVALSHGQPQSIPGMPDEVNQAYETAWQEMQGELAALSTRGRHQVVEGSGHAIHHDRPDVVVAAIREVVEAINEKTRRPA